jgi:hypothetical protein
MAGDTKPPPFGGRKRKRELVQSSSSSPAPDSSAKNSLLDATGSTAADRNGTDEQPEVNKICSVCKAREI